MLSTLGLSLSMTVPSTSKGMNRVALVEFGSGCCHSDNSATVSYTHLTLPTILLV